jgi:xanthine dehydrogenase small subunit
MAVRFVLNGETIAVDAVDPHVTLLEWLRRSGRTGTKEGCAEGECGACAVAVIGRDSHGRSCYRPVNSCLVPLPAVDGQRLVSVEGVQRGDGELHPVQRALVELGGSQCGYCTPGFVISLFCEYYRPGRDGVDPEAISGNLCRCTGYRPILDVLKRLPKPAQDEPELEPLCAPVTAVMELDHGTAGRRFRRPTSLAQALEHLEEDPEAMPIAGGTDLMVYANQRYERWQTLVSLEAVAELRELRVEPGEIVIGAGVALADLEEALARAPGHQVPLIEQVLPLFSSRLIRNRATIGGSLGTASPIGDLAPALLALEAELTLVSRRATRRLPLADFFLDYRKTALDRAELIQSVHLPSPLSQHQRFYKVSKRVLDDISTVAGAFALDLDRDGRVARLRVAFGGIAATPLRARALEQAATGCVWDAGTVQRVIGEVPAIGTPLDDHRGSAAYRRAMIGKLFEKFLAETTHGGGS